MPLDQVIAVVLDWYLHVRPKLVTVSALTALLTLFKLAALEFLSVQYSVSPQRLASLSVKLVQRISFLEES